MIKNILLTGAAVALVTGGASMAQEPGSFTASAGYTVVDGNGADLGAIALRGRYDFNQTFGVEGEAMIGIVDEDVVMQNTTIELSVDHGFAAFLVARAPIGENGSNLFARAGYGTIQISGSAGNVSASQDLDGFGIGVGGEFFLLENQGVRVDYTRYDGDDGELDTYGVSWVVRF